MRALERTGEVEAAALDSGIDKSTAYYRRKAHADFAEAWDAALARRAGAQEAEVKERVGFWERLRGKVTRLPAAAVRTRASTGAFLAQIRRRSQSW